MQNIALLKLKNIKLGLFSGFLSAAVVVCFTASMAFAQTSVATRIAALHLLANANGNPAKIEDPDIFPNVAAAGAAPFSSAISGVNPLAQAFPTFPQAPVPAIPQVLWCFTPGPNGEQLNGHMVGGGSSSPGGPQGGYGGGGYGGGNYGGGYPRGNYVSPGLPS